MAQKILVVDDSSSMRQMISFTLKSAGYEVEEANDGLAFIKEVHKLPNYKFTPILVLTTEAGTDKKMEGKAAGATGWLVKPFNPEQLLNTAKKVL